MGERSVTRQILPIFLTTFINMLAIGVIIPVIAPIIIDNTTEIFSPDFPVNYRHIIMGMLTACFPLAQFFGAPVLGAWSDRIGRKPVLLLSLLGSGIGFVLFGVAIIYDELWLMFASRLLDGFTGGNISVVYSAVSDISDDKARARNFGLIGMAFGLGFILGPMTGGLLSDSDIVSWFNAATPFWATAILFLINILLVLLLFPETSSGRSEKQIRLFSGIENIRKAFSLPAVRTVLTVLFFQTLGFSFFVQFFQVFLIEKHAFDTADIGRLFGFIGIWIALSQGLFVRILTRYFRSDTLVRFFNFALAIALPLVLLPDETFMLYVLAPLIAISQGNLAPNMTAVVSFKAEKSEQGSILGINQSIQSLGQALPPIIAGILSSVNIYFPTIAASVFVFIAGFIFLFKYKPEGRSQSA